MESNVDERELAALVEHARERLMSRRVSGWDAIKDAPGEAVLVLLASLGALGGIVSLSSHFFGIQFPSNPLLLLILPVFWLAWFDGWDGGIRGMRLQWEISRSLRHAPATIIAKTYCETFSWYGKDNGLWSAMHSVWMTGEARAFDYLADPQREPFERPKAVQDASDKDGTDDSPRKQG